MANSIRWTEDELKAYRLRMEKPDMPGVDIDAVHKKRTPKAPEPRKESKLEIRFVQQLAEAGIAGYTRNYFPIMGRDWELDFSWVPAKLAVEVDGMAHRTKGRFKADFQKHAALMLEGWRVLRVCGDDIRHGRAIEWTKQLLACS